MVSCVPASCGAEVAIAVADAKEPAVIGQPALVAPRRSYEVAVPITPSSPGAVQPRVRPVAVRLVIARSAIAAGGVVSSVVAESAAEVDALPTASVTRSMKQYGV